MKNKGIMKLIGLPDKLEIECSDEYLELKIRDEVEKTIKEVDDEIKREKEIGFYKDSYEEYKQKQNLIELLKSRMVVSALVDVLRKEGAIFNCPYCLDLSHHYVKARKRNRDE